MQTLIHHIGLGFDDCWIIQGDKAIMIDGGAPGQGKAFDRALADRHLPPESVQLLIITHGHWDHIATASHIKKTTGARIAMHHLEQEWLERSLKPQPPGVTPWGRVLGQILAGIMPLVHIPPATVDMTLDGKNLPLPLAEFGIPGKIIHTPGHSPGSVSVVLDSGEAFVGDLAMHKLPLRRSPGLPIFADDLGIVKQSWLRILNAGARTIYPAHGKPFSADVFREVLGAAA